MCNWYMRHEPCLSVMSQISVYKHTGGNDENCNVHHITIISVEYQPKHSTPRKFKIREVSYASVPKGVDVSLEQALEEIRTDKNNKKWKLNKPILIYIQTGKRSDAQNGRGIYRYIAPSEDVDEEFKQDGDVEFMKDHINQGKNVGDLLELIEKGGEVA